MQWNPHADKQAFGALAQASWKPATHGALQPGHRIAQAEAVCAIRQALARIPPHQRALLLLAHLTGLSYADIAERLGVPLSTVRVGIRNARRSLRRMLAALRDDALELPEGALDSILAETLGRSKVAA